MSALSALIVTAALIPQGAMAQSLPPPLEMPDGAQQDYARLAVAEGRFLPLVRVLDIALRAEPGQIVEVELELDDGQWLYEVEIATDDGRLIEIDLEATTGTIVEIEDDDD